MSRRWPEVDRRTALRLAVLGALSLSTIPYAPAPGAVALPRPVRVAAASIVDESRYRFDPVTPVPGFAPLGRLEEVWTSPGYLTTTACVVSYVGPTPYRLTAPEALIVGVAQDNGAIVTDRQATFLLILSASTRIDPAHLQEKLSELGRGIVAASLALAPDAPQAKQFRAWLDATS